MNQPEEDALDPEMVALLRADFAPASAAVKERVSSRLTHSVGALALSGTTPVAVNPNPSLSAAFRAHRVGFIASFGLGAIFGGGMYAAARRPEPARIVYVDRPVVPAASPVPSAPSTAPRPSEPPASAQSVPASSATVLAPVVSAERSSPASLAEQQALLDVARSAFARSDYAATLDALSSHFRRYPKSLLGEEREALEIKALAASGRDAEAKARAARFKAQFPQSLLMPSVNDSIGAIP
ncbi:MAG TPA: hypothetical protein VNW92_28575 [Polyangiaceae bacterium]|jgi:hypothetical protein|nr:hypothetical protein [Polyangiaceae bacterium]